jgi:hypothetical protein
MFPVIAALVLSVVTVASAQSPSLRAASSLNLKVANVTVGEALGAIERASGVTIRIDASVPADSLGRTGVNLTFRDARVAEAIGVVCDLANLAVVVADENTVVIQPKAR